jgi:secondary thiamine-phosphate synthase enzyme
VRNEYFLFRSRRERGESMIAQFALTTRSRSSMEDITAQVEKVVRDSGVSEGLCCVYCPHTTAGVTVNEGADPDVKADILATLDEVVPWSGRYRHVEGNSAAHVKATLVGSSATLIVQEGRLALGTWQSIYFCEFDGPRQRRVFVRVG